MLKKLLILMIFIGSIMLIACDVTVKRCTYAVYQVGIELPSRYHRYTIRLSDKCPDFSENGTFYKLISVDHVKAQDIRQ